MLSSANRQVNPAIEVIARALVFRGDSVLACCSKAGNYCYLPGGHVEFGEGARLALAREFHEETGIGVTVGPCVAVHENVFDQGGTPRHEVNLVFLGELPANAKITSQESEIEFRWIPLDRLETEKFVPGDAIPVIRKIARDPRNMVFLSSIGKTTQ